MSEYMFIHQTLKIADYTLTLLGVLSAVVALYMWAQAVLVWGDAYAYAEALTFTVVTVVIFGLGAGVQWLQNRGE